MTARVSVLFLNVGVDLRLTLCAQVEIEGVYPSFYDWPRAGDGEVFEIPRLRGRKPRFDLVILDCGVEELPERFFPWREPLAATLAEYGERPVLLTTHISVVNVLSNREKSRGMFSIRRIPQIHFAERDVDQVLAIIRQQKERITAEPPDLSRRGPALTV